jgi:hypothetical protein
MYSAYAEPRTPQGTPPPPPCTLRASVGRRVCPRAAAQEFPHLVWVLRDFALQLSGDAGEGLTASEYLERSLRPSAGFSAAAEAKNRLRRALRAFFPSRECVTLQRPAEEEARLQVGPAPAAGARRVEAPPRDVEKMH